MGLQHLPFRPTAGFNNALIPNAALFDGSTGYLSYTPSPAGNDDLFSVNMWVKRSALGGTQNLYIANGTSSIGFNSSNQLIVDRPGATILATTAVFRDTSGFMNIHVDFDVTNGTAANRVVITINGVVITDYATDNRAGLVAGIFTFQDAVVHAIGRHPSSGIGYYDGYVAELHNIDNSNIPATSFGKFSTKTPANWEPIKVSGLTYGTNGFHLDFSNGADLGEDSSGNGNDWIVNGTITQSTDTPSDNVAVLNRLSTQASATLSQGNTEFICDANLRASPSTFLIEPGQAYYWEAQPTDANGESNSGTGVVTSGHNFWSSTDNRTSSDCWFVRFNGNAYFNSTTPVATFTAITQSDICGIAYKDGDLWIARNGAWISGDPALGTSPTFTGITEDQLMTGLMSNGSGNSQVFFLEDDWTYAAPTGFKALTSSNFPKVADARLEDHFQVELVNHDGISTAFTLNWDGDIDGTAFEIKNRDTAEKWYWQDSVRGLDKTLSSDKTNAEITDSNVISVSGNTVTLGSTLANSNYVVTCHKLDTQVTSGWAGSPTITPTEERYNATLGMSAIKYTGDGVSGATIPHSGGKKPFMVIIKNLTDATSWPVYHEAVGATKYSYLNSTNAFAASASFWNNTEPTNEVFTVGSHNNVNDSGDEYIAYLFYETDSGMCKPIVFEGNSNADGSFWNGMGSPMWGLCKNADAAQNWHVYDGVRDTYNPQENLVYANLSNAEATWTQWDATAVGYKLRQSHAAANGATMVGVAFVDPFTGKKQSPVNAR